MQIMLPWGCSLGTPAVLAVAAEDTDTLVSDQGTHSEGGQISHYQLDELGVPAQAQAAG